MNIKKSKERRKIRSKPASKGTKETPRLSVFRSNRYIYVQAIDDENGNTITSSSSIKKGKAKTTRSDDAVQVGKSVGENLKKAGIKKVYFDRSGYKYHGRVKKLADAIRESGITV